MLGRDLRIATKRNGKLNEREVELTNQPDGKGVFL